MQKMVSVMGPQVKDLGGLYVELRKQSFAVLNVGSDQAGTYVYLETTEVKDPTPYVEEWVDKPAPLPTKGEVRKRKEEIDKIVPPRPTPLTVMIPHTTEPPLPSVDTTPAADAETAGDGEPKTGFLKFLLKKLFK